MMRLAVSMFLVGSCLTSCAKTLPREPASATEVPVALEPRERRPKSTADAPFTPPEVIERRLDNRIRMLIVERRELPIVKLAITVNRGAADAPPGVASSAMTLLLDRKGFVPALSTHIWADYDALYLTGVSITRFHSSSNLPDVTFATLAELMRAPEFMPSSLEREEERRRIHAAAAEEPWERLDRAIRETLYPSDHPYRQFVAGDRFAQGQATPALLNAF